MSLNKAIKSGKEHRKEYRGAKAVDNSCRNHGGRHRSKIGNACPYCERGRLYQVRKEKEANEYQW